MSDNMTISFVKHPDIDHLQHAKIEVDGDEKSDRIIFWGPKRGRLGFGFGSHDTTAFGFGSGPGFGVGVFGYGYFGQGAEKLEHKTIDKYVSSDYSVRTRMVDGVGNIGGWSAASIIQHRTVPNSPAGLAIDANTLTWTWSET